MQSPFTIPFNFSGQIFSFSLNPYLEQDTENAFDAILKINTQSIANVEDFIQVDIKRDPNITQTEESMSNEKRNAIRERSKLWYTRDIPYTFRSEGMYRLN